jgi:peptidoglycan/xylan/chitin deacetylase (PgdA/CDA1 family)
MYHGITKSPLPVHDWCFVTETAFREQVRYLRDHFQLTCLSNAVDLLRRGSLSRPTAVITFDDGYSSTYDLAFPLLKEAGCPATIFLATQFVDSEDTLWFCRLNGALTASSRSSFSWNGRTFSIRDPLRKASVSLLLQGELKNLPPSRIATALDDIVRVLTDSRNVSAISPFRILSSAQISEMASSGLIEFGAHTHSHPILSRLSAAEQEEEITLSKQEVERLTHRSCRFFSYPNGRSQDYDGETVRLLEKCGFTAAVTTINGPNLKNTPLLELNRYMAGEVDHANFSAAVHHFAWSGKTVAGGLIP